jgi:3-oxoacyl-[acyl-carrier-protein] synthase-3
MVMRKNGNGAASSPGTGIYAHVVGWGMAVPDTVLSNLDLEAIVDTTDEWIQSRTGIKERRIAGERESTATLGLKAAQRALEVADIVPAELDLIIVATSTPDFVFPATASLIQAGLGANRAGAFDLSAACSGFVYGVNMAAQSIRSGSIQTALVIGAETMSRVVDWQDRGTCILFGDGAGAVVLQASRDEGGVLSSVLRSDGTGCDLLGLPSVGSYDAHANGSMNGHRLHKMHMNGGEVFKFATRVIGESITEATALAGMKVTDLNLIVPHQANARIIAAAARSMKVDESLFASNLASYGNTSAASIPIALCEALGEGRIKPGDNVAFVGFGGGLAWASMVVKWTTTQPGDRASRRSRKRQQREWSYFLARLRARLTRWSRVFDNVLRRTRPELGRMERLRRKVERELD